MTFREILEQKLEAILYAILHIGEDTNEDQTNDT